MFAKLPRRSVRSLTPKFDGLEGRAMLSTASPSILLPVFAHVEIKKAPAVVNTIQGQHIGTAVASGIVGQHIGMNAIQGGVLNDLNPQPLPPGHVAHPDLNPQPLPPGVR